MISKYITIESFISGRDDVGSTNIEAVCKSGAKLLHRPMPQWINDRGEWGECANCPPEAPSVCGIKSRIDDGSPNRYFVIFCGVKETPVARFSNGKVNKIFSYLLMTLR